MDDSDQDSESESESDLENSEFYNATKHDIWESYEEHINSQNMVRQGQVEPSFSDTKLKNPVTFDKTKILKQQEVRLATLKNYCEKFRLAHPANRLKLLPNIRHKKLIYSNTPKEFVYCLPLKTGTTNWQRGFVKNFSPNITEKYLNPPLIFKMLYRVSYIESLDKRRRALIDRSIIRGINVRHPFSRLYSAYHQKFELTYYKKYENAYS